MRIVNQKTIIRRDEMARIFEMLCAGRSMKYVASVVGYDCVAIKRGIVIAELLGFEGCA